MEAEHLEHEDTVDHNKERIKEYIKSQLVQDQLEDQMSLNEFIDPFAGGKNTKAQNRPL